MAIPRDAERITFKWRRFEPFPLPLFSHFRIQLPAILDQ
jgi:hypothetical protein